MTEESQSILTLNRIKVFRNWFSYLLSHESNYASYNPIYYDFYSVFYLLFIMLYHISWLLGYSATCITSLYHKIQV